MSFILFCLSLSKERCKWVQSAKFVVFKILKNETVNKGLSGFLIRHGWQSRLPLNIDETSCTWRTVGWCRAKGKKGSQEI